MTFSQTDSQVRCEWGPQGVLHLAPHSDAVILVDVLSFTTCVSIAVARGACVYPYRFRDASARQFADSVGAVLAGPRASGGCSLSPASLSGLPTGARLVLPSPNGSTLTLMTGQTPTFAGCLRNARAVAEAAMRCGTRIAVIPAGERWGADDTLRPALEDLVGAGAIVHYLQGSRSPEAELAVAVFQHMQGCLPNCLRRCSSGKELADMGFAGDVALAAELGVDQAAPLLVDGAYRQCA